jgi:tyrosine-protein phosphatase YwqE
LVFQVFQKKEILAPADLALLGTDIHSHLIPAVDDGSKSLEDSINMIRSFQEMGYKKIITTPHVMSDFYKNTPETILGGLSDVRAELKSQNIDIELEAAAEYYLDEVLEPQVKEGSC